MPLADLHPQDQLYIGYLTCRTLLIVGFTGWFLANMRAIIAANGSLDLYLNFAFRLLPLDLGLFFVWTIADSALASFFAV